LRRVYNRPMDKRGLLAVLVLGIAAGVGIYIFLGMQRTIGRTSRMLEWLRDPSAHPDWSVKAGIHCSPGAPFLMPTDGLIGYLWDDSFKAGKRHQGIDIFGGKGVGKSPVVAAYPGVLTRLPAWKSAVIVRVPSDPLQPGRQIWLYYTHMADPNGNSSRQNSPPAPQKSISKRGPCSGSRGITPAMPPIPPGCICISPSSLTMDKAVFSMNWISTTHSIRRCTLV